jgi:hypothetical protein
VVMAITTPGFIWMTLSSRLQKKAYHRTLNKLYP